MGSTRLEMGARPGRREGRPRGSDTVCLSQEEARLSLGGGRVRTCTEGRALGQGPTPSPPQGPGRRASLGVAGFRLHGQGVRGRSQGTGSPSECFGSHLDGGPVSSLDEGVAWPLGEGCTGPVWPLSEHQAQAPGRLPPRAPRTPLGAGTPHGGQALKSSLCGVPAFPRSLLRANSARLR